MEGESTEALFAQLEGTISSPVDLATDLFHEKTRDYLAAIILGIEAPLSAERDALDLIRESADQMGTSTQTLAREFYRDDPDTALSRIVDTIFTHKLQQESELDQYSHGTSTTHVVSSDKSLLFSKMKAAQTIYDEVYGKNDAFALAAEYIVLNSARERIRRLK